MISPRTRIAAAIAAAVALAVGAPVAGASATTPVPVPAPPGLLGGDVPGLGAAPWAPGACGTATVEGQGGTGGSEAKICIGAGVAFVGPAVGQIATVVGPTVVGPAVIGVSIVSAGAVAVP